MATYYWIGGNGTWNGSNTTNWSLTSGGLPGVAVPTSTDTVIFDSASGTGICTTANGSACATATLNSSTLGLTLGANHTMSGAFTLTLGALDLNNNVLTCLSLSSSNTNVRSIAFGTGKIVLTGNNTAIIAFAAADNFTYSGTSRIECSYAGATGTRTLQFGATSGASQATVMNVYVTAGTDIVSAGSNWKTLDFTGFAGTLGLSTRVIYGNLIISSGMSLTAGASSTTFAATSGTQQITINGKTLDFPVTFNGVGGTFQLQDNCTVGSTRTVTLTNGTLDLNNQTLSTGLFSSSNSNTRSIAFGTGNITLTGSGATIFNTGTSTGLSVTGTPVVNCTYAGSTGTRTVSVGSTASEANSISFNINAGTDTVALSSGGQVYRNVDFTGFTGTLSSGNRVCYGNLTYSSGMTVTAVGSWTFAATSGTKTITTAGQNLDVSLAFNGIGGTWEFADALTQASTRGFTITNGTVKLKAGVTSTVGVFLTSGSNQKYLQSTLAGSQATLSQASGTVSVSYLTIKDINATGGATWNAYRSLNNIDAGNNTGWDFLSTPVTTTSLSMRLGIGL